MSPPKKGPAGPGGSGAGGDLPKRNISTGRGRAAAATRLQAIRIALCHDLIRAGRLLERRGMIVASQGNLSARLSTEIFVVTRRGRRKGELNTRDFVDVGTHDSGEVPGPLQASSEFRMHQIAYRVRRDAEAVLHAHPVGLTAFSVRGSVPDFSRFDEARELVGPVAFVPYLPSGTQALAEALGRALAGPARPNLAILQHHGAVSVGRSVDEALARLEVAEHLATTLLAAERR